MTSVRPAAPDDADRLDAFVRAHPAGTPFHLAAWRRAVAEIFPRYTDRTLVALDGDAVAGLLPLMEVRTPWSHVLVSTPHAVYGGVLAATDAAANALLDDARALAERTRADAVELRNRDPSPFDLPAKGGYVTFVKDLPEDPNGCLDLLPRKARAAARKARDKFRVTGQVRDIDAAPLLHRLFVLNKRELGSPAYPRAFFEAILRHFGEAGRYGEAADLLVMEVGGKPAAAVLSLYFGDTVFPYYSGTDPAFRDAQVSNLMYVRLMEHAVAKRGVRRFDFGRSREGTGAYRFKVHQGFEPSPLHYQVMPVAKAAPADVRPDNPALDLPTRLWRRLPVPLVARLGGWAIRYFP